jgi:hypothetical protein
VRKSLTALVILLIAESSSVAAQRRPKAAPPSPIVDALSACRAIADKDARLACYDQASARFAEAVGKGEVIVMDQQEVKQTRRSLFGFHLPSLPLFRGDSGPDQDELTAKIASASGLGYDKYRMRLEDGAIWETTEASSRISPPRSGQDVLIKRGPLGSYMMRIDGQRAVRAKRVE